MRAKRAEKYRGEVRKVNTGINRKNRELQQMAEYAEALRVIRTWAVCAHADLVPAYDRLEMIARKCDRVLGEHVLKEWPGSKRKERPDER